MISFIVSFFLASTTVSAQSATVKVAIDPAPVLSFSDAYVLIQRRNLNLQSQQLNVLSSRARKLGQVGTFLPSLNLVASDTQTGVSNARTSSATPELRAAALTVSANLFKSGADFAGLKAANRDIDASQDILQQQQLNAEDDAASTLISLIAKTRERELIAQLTSIKQESLKIARERYAKGLLAAQEVDKTQIDLDNAQAKLTDADVSLAAARAAVSARLGNSQNVQIVWPWKSAILTGPRPDASPFKLEDRPDYRASVKTLEAEDWRIHASRAHLLPSIDLSASYGNFDLSQTDRRDWSTILTLTVPIFEGFRGWSATRLQSLVKQQAELQRETIRRDAHAEIESQTVVFRAARDSAVAREKTSKISARLFNDNLQRFRLGRASVNELSIDQQRLLDAQILEVEGWSNAHLGFVRLCHALGHSVLANGSCDTF